MNLKTRIDREIWTDCIKLWLYAKDGDVMQVSSNVVMQAHKPGELICDAPIRLDRVAAQELMDQLWSAGLRPTEGKGSAGSLAATERHLADMRALVFKMPPKA